MKLLFWNSSGLTDGINKVTVIHKVSFVHVDGELKQGSQGQGRLTRSLRKLPVRLPTALSEETFLKMVCLGLMMVDSRTCNHSNKDMIPDYS